MSKWYNLKGIIYSDYIMAEFLQSVPPEQAANLSAVTLAFVGDAVQSLIVRRGLALVDRPASQMQKLASEKVSAVGQNAQLARVERLFTEEEAAIYRRGRNAKKPTKAKNASVSEYNRSTGFEAVLGYLYLTGQFERIEQLLNT